MGQLQLDNAGEFMSREFTEYLEDESIARTTCPPHVHQLNGVAERSIRSIMEIVRATREASECPIGFWPHLVEHAVDVLNRVTGPPRERGQEATMCVRGRHGAKAQDPQHLARRVPSLRGEASRRARTPSPDSRHAHGPVSTSAALRRSQELTTSGCRREES